MVALSGISAALLFTSQSNGARWEYTITSFSDEKFTEEINKMGAQRWELASARRAVTDTGRGDTQGVYECIFRRAMPHVR